MQAVERFVAGEDNAVIAYELRVSIRSVQRWRMAFTHGGRPAVAPVVHVARSPGGPSVLSQ